MVHNLQLSFCLGFIVFNTVLAVSHPDVKCLSFGFPPFGSSCMTNISGITWLNPPDTLVTFTHGSRLFHDSLVDDPAFSRGIRVSGEVRFKLQFKEEHLIEVFIIAEDAGKHGFSLYADGLPVDTLYGQSFKKVRMRPKSSRTFSLVGIVNGDALISVSTAAPDWVLSAVRATPAQIFEDEQVSPMLERARNLTADPFFEHRLQKRVRSMEELWHRLIHSKVPAVRQESLIGYARAAYWEAVENHEPLDVARTEMLFRILIDEVPDNNIVRQMISASCLNQNLNQRLSHQMPSGDFCQIFNPVPWHVEVADSPRNAPGWAVSQRKLAKRMEAITSWWVHQRQLENGEIGGGWGDDVEMLRQWTIQALGFGSTTAALGLERIADGIWVSDEIQYGYNRTIRDVEHSAEPTSDTEPFLAALLPDESKVLERLATTTECLKNWLVSQPDGRWRFSGAWFNCREMDATLERAVDVHYNLRAAGPAIWYAYLTRDPDVIDRLVKWGEAWVEVMRASDHGKPPGIFPSAVESKNGNYLIRSDVWDKPNAEWDYFQWSGDTQERLTSFMLSLYTLTGDNRWIEAAGESFQVMKHADQYPELCKKIRSSPNAYFEWRRLTGSDDLDSVFGVPKTPNRVEILALMEQQADQMEAFLGINFDMWTKEVIFTDRVYYRFLSEYQWYLFGGGAPRGDGAPSFAVTWPPADLDVAHVVLDWTETHLVFEAYNLEKQPVDLPIRFWQLTPGLYQWEIKALEEGLVDQGTVQIDKLPYQMRFSLPPGKTATVSISARK